MRPASLAALTLAGVAVAAAATAQQRRPFPPLPVPAATLERAPLSFTLSQSLEANTNYDLVNDPGGTTYYGETRFALDYLRAADTSLLSLGIDSGLRGVEHPDDDFEWVAASPSLAYLTYRAEGVDTLFDADVRARSRIVDSTTTVLIPGDPGDPDVPDDDIPDTLDQVDLDAREYRYDANIGFTGGTSSPSTWGVRILANTFDYDEEANNLTPRTTVNPQANWRLRLTPVFSGVLFGGYYYYNADNRQETEIRVAEADAGVIYEPSDRLLLGFGLGYADRRREETNTVTGVRDEVEHETGPVLRGNLRYLLPNLTVTGDARWTTASAENNHFSGSLAGFYALPRGTFRGRIYQRAVGDSTGNEVRVTGATIGLEREINTVSRVGLDLGWATQVNLEDDTEDPDITRTDFIASYAYDLTATVTAEVGYNYQTRDEEPIDTDSHRVFLVLGKTFETGL